MSSQNRSQRPEAPLKRHLSETPEPEEKLESDEIALATSPDTEEKKAAASLEKKAASGKGEKTKKEVSEKEVAAKPTPKKPRKSAETKKEEGEEAKPKKEENQEAPAAAGGEQPPSVKKEEEKVSPLDQAAKRPPLSAAAATVVSHVVERGRIMFFYRPKVGLEEASSLAEVRHFYFFLIPEEASGHIPRMALVGKKRMPDIKQHERFFGFIQAVGPVELLNAHMGAKTYETKTRGTRHLSAARLEGEGTYAIVRRGAGGGTHPTNLVFELQLPEHPGDVQRDFHIPKQGSYVFSVKNPTNVGTGPGGRPLGLKDKAQYSKEQLEEFGNYSWIGVTDPTLLEVPHCEFLLVGATEDVEKELHASVQELAGSGGDAVAAMCPNADEACLLDALKKELGESGSGEASYDKEHEVLVERGVDFEPMETGHWK